MNIPDSKKPLGLILQQADLISPAQIELALRDQTQFKHLQFGEILALRGWIKQETADFFAEQWPELLTSQKRLPIGYYLRAAGLLDEDQVDTILFDQQLLGTKFGSTAILKGWLKKTTVEFFLKYLAHEPQNSQLFPTIEYSEDFLSTPTPKNQIIYVGEPQITIPKSLMI